MTFTFESSAGHWEISSADGEMGWVDAWPCYGDDAGRTNITVSAAVDATPREKILDIRASGGKIGEIIIRQDGMVPVISTSLATGSIRTDVAGTPVEVMVEANFEWEVSVTEGSEWITVSREGNSLLVSFTDNSGNPSRKGTIVISMVGGDCTLTIPVSQLGGNYSYEDARRITVADLLAGVTLGEGGRYEIGDNLRLDACVVTDFGSGNLPADVLYLQDGSGRGLKVLPRDAGTFISLPDGKENWLDLGREVSIHLAGMEFIPDENGAPVLSDFNPAVLMSSADFQGDPVAVELADFSRVESCVNTLVTLPSAEFCEPFGPFGNIYEKSDIEAFTKVWAETRKESYRKVFPEPKYCNRPIRDNKGNVLEMWFMAGFKDFYTAPVPAGSGRITALVYKFRGETCLAIRNTSDVAISPDVSTRFSKTLLKAGPWDSAAQGESPSFEVGNTDGDSSRIRYSHYDTSTGSTWNVGPANDARWLSYNVRRDVSSSVSSSNRHQLLNTRNLWNVTTGSSLLSTNEELGEGFLVTTNVFRNITTGRLTLGITGAGSSGGPAYMKVQWTDYEGDDFTQASFHDIGRYICPNVDTNPYNKPFTFILPDELKGKERITFAIRADGNENTQLQGSPVTLSGTNRLAYVWISQVE